MATKQHLDVGPYADGDAADFAKFVLRLNASIAMSEKERLLHEKAAVRRQRNDLVAAEAARAYGAAPRPSRASAPRRSGRARAARPRAARRPGEPGPRGGGAKRRGGSDREHEAALADAKAARAAELDALKASHDAALAAAARHAKRLEAELATTRDLLATTALSRDRAVRDLEERDASTLQDRREDALMDESAKRLDADLRSQVDALRRERDEARLAAAQQKKIAEVASSRRRDRLRSKSPRARPPAKHDKHDKHDYVKENARHHARKPHIHDVESHHVLETAATPSARHPAPAAKPEPGTERSTPRGTSAFAAAAHRRSSDPSLDDARRLLDAPHGDGGDEMSAPPPPGGYQQPPRGYQQPQQMRAAPQGYAPPGAAPQGGFQAPRAMAPQAPRGYAAPQSAPQAPRGYAAPQSQQAPRGYAQPQQAQAPARTRRPRGGRGAQGYAAPRGAPRAAPQGGFGRPRRPRHPRRREAGVPGAEARRPPGACSGGGGALRAAPGSYAPPGGAPPAPPKTRAAAAAAASVVAAVQGFQPARQPAPGAAPGAATPAAPVVIDEAAQCDPRFMRCTVGKLANSAQTAAASKVPIGIVCQPMALDTDHEAPLDVVNFGSTGIVRCKKCRAYVNPFVSWQRPELCKGSVELVAPGEYMVRPPQPPVFVFVIDVSAGAVATGMLGVVAKTIRASLDGLPGAPRTQVAVITFDASVHFYNLKASLSQPQMVCVPDLSDLFVPLPDDLLVNLAESRSVVEALLDALPAMHSASSPSSASALGPALTAARGIQPAQICVELFVAAHTYADVATLGLLPKITAGQLYFYPGFKASHDGEKLATELARALTRPTGFEAVMRVRCTRGLRVAAFRGNYYIRGHDLLALPNCTPESVFDLEIAHDDQPLTASVASIQASLLYTTSSGERRIRVHTMVAPVSGDVGAIAESASVDALSNVVAKRAVDVALKQGAGPNGQAQPPKLPESLQLLPLYTMALLKSAAFRGGADVRADERSYMLQKLDNMSPDQTRYFVYPRLFALHQPRRRRQAARPPSRSRRPRTSPRRA
ncbi:hypothetical protein JL721_6453 [Aureococcus anophagefferens]|nr:hypothetical protein JL721_6453 [Aureococcus anophagefferens]